MTKIYPLIAVFFALLTACSASRTARTDAVEIADSANKTRSGMSGYNAAAAGFLVDAADARMMDIREGRSAVKYGTTPEIRSYGHLMVKDQNALLVRIRKLAAARQITLPGDISNSKKEGFSQLAELRGKDFDSKFIKMMIIDHERDVAEFTGARKLDDHGVAAFATEKLPTIQSHLDKINAIRDMNKN